MPLQYEAAVAIRALPDLVRARVPIIAVSASALQSDIERSHASGMDAHIAKPIDSEALAACVLRWVSESREHAPLSPGAPKVRSA